MNNPNAMGNSAAGGSMSMSTDMTPWLHFGNGDHVLFSAWQPSSPGAFAGACIGLVVFSTLERCLSAYRRTQEVRWKARATAHAHVIYTAAANKEDGPRTSEETLAAVPTRAVPPFFFSRDAHRGLIQALQSAFAYALMLVVMTYNGAFIIAILLGLGTGEVLFGRIGR